MKTLVELPIGPVTPTPPPSEAEPPPDSEPPVGAPAPMDPEFLAWLAELL